MMLKSLIKQNGYKAVDIAKMADVSPTYIGMVCNGQRGMSVKTAKKIAPALNITWWELLDMLEG